MNSSICFSVNSSMLLPFIYSVYQFNVHDIVFSKFILDLHPNLLIALETIPDGKKHYWKNDSYKGYITPINTVINEEGYFCRNYIEVLIKRSEYNIYENKTCRDNDGE